MGLPAIDDNICEGIVIRPVVPMYLRNGSRVLIKSKNERFAEKKSVKKRNKLFAEPIPFSEALQTLIAEGEAYVTVNRLINVVSHIGEVHFPKDFGKVMGLFSKDVLDDFSKSTVVPTPPSTSASRSHSTKSSTSFAPPWLSRYT